MYIILPYCHHGDLFTVVSTRGLRENEAKVIFANVLEGMSFVHASGVCHRWVENPDNMHHVSYH